MMNKETYDPAKRHVKIGSAEAKRFKKLGDFGEIIAETLLLDNGFQNVKNLNLQKYNFEFADFYAEKEGEKFLISVKTRNKFEYTGKLNSRYKLGKNIEVKIISAKQYPEFVDCKPAWLAIAIRPYPLFA